MCNAIVNCYVSDAWEAAETAPNRSPPKLPEGPQDQRCPAGNNGLALQPFRSSTAILDSWVLFTFSETFRFSSEVALKPLQALSVLR